MKKLFLSMALVMSMGLLMTSCGDDEKEPDGPSGPDATATTLTEQTTEIDGKTLKTVTINEFGQGIGTRTLTKDKVYILDGFVFVNDGQTLTIEPGTIIKGRAGDGPQASALIVARGGKIMAEGTAAEPIVFTSAADNLVRYTDGTLAGGANLDENDARLWGGLILLGKAGNTNGNIIAIEGIPTTETRGLYGGTDDDDNSGVLRYVSVRHGGSEIGAGNEINGITLGGVGRGTTMEYIEVYATFDDGIEWFGGTVDLKYAVVNNAGDDSFDYDEGWRGRVQFVLTILGADSDRGGEHDGGPSDCETCTPYATPMFYNATYIGNGTSRALTFRDNAGGQYHNSIFTNFNKGVDIENTVTPGTTVEGAQHSFKRFQDGDLKIMNNVFDGVAGDDITKIILEVSKDAAAVNSDLWNATNASGNTVEATGVTATNPVPTTAISATAPTDTWFTAANYKGAFDGTNWAAGWTKTFGSN